MTDPRAVFLELLDEYVDELYVDHAAMEPTRQRERAEWVARFDAAMASREQVVHAGEPMTIKVERLLRSESEVVDWSDGRVRKA